MSESRIKPQILIRRFRNYHFVQEHYIPTEFGIVSIFSNRLVQLMEEEHLYRNPTLRLNDLAESTDHSLHHISQLINQQMGMSFSDFVNQYRVNEARALLNSPRAKEITILAIGQEEHRQLFHQETRRLLERDLSVSRLGLDKTALMGLALGLRDSDDHDLRTRFRIKVIDQLPDIFLTLEFDQFLLSILNRVNSFSQIAPQEYALYVQLSQRRETGQELTPEQVSRLKKHFLQAWKSDLPFLRTDPFRTLLTVSILDQSLAMSVWDPDAVANLRSQILDPIRKAIQQHTDRMARQLTTLLVSLGIPLLGMISFYFFHKLDQSDGLKTISKDSDSFFYFLGGTINAFLFLVGLALFLFGKKTIRWDYRHLSDRMAQYLRRRTLHRLGIPTS